MADTFYIDGLKEVEQAIKDLPVKMQASVYRAINRKAVQKYVVNDLRGVLNYSAKTESAIKIVTDVEDKTAVYGGVTSDAFYLRFADRGTAERYTEKGAYRGKIIGRNQIQPLILGSVDNIIKFMNEKLGDEIVKILERRIKSTRKQISKLNL
jgi:hypothetical protein